MTETTTPDQYDPHRVEAHWQDVWERQRTWEVSTPSAPGAKPAYVLEMLPYTSGEPHVGHLKNYAVGDAVAHFLRRQGHYVLHPMGYDAFGLPAENHAIRTGQHPRVSTEASIASFREQFKRWGVSIDWTREISTHEPTYYRWTQWIFLRLLKAGLAHRRRSAVNWCPVDATVLANEQVVDGACERCGTPVELRQLEQWFLRITDYAERLLDGLDDLDWPEHVKTMQRAWIGRAAGVEVTFRVAGSGEEVRVFTTRPDTIFGVSFLALSPEHPELARFVTPSQAEAVRTYVNAARRAGHSHRGNGQRAMTGVLSGAYVTHPFTGELIPVVVADHVLMEYGSGAVMGVPAHDERDFGLARILDLPVIRVVVPPDGEGARLPFTGAGRAVNSGDFDGLPSDEAAARIVAALAAGGQGGPVVEYKLRDWLVSRQRYWGCPIPVVHCDGCGIVPVPEEQLPVELPAIDDFAPQGRSPLAVAEDWMNTRCPECGGSALRETDTMDTFVDSSWYFLRYCDPRNDQAPWSREAVNAWLPVDQYIGGVEHAILHLLYSRFLCKALADMDLLPVQEPFGTLFTQGMITRDGAKMSKSKGNVVSPRTIVDRYGADTARTYVLFMAPPEVGGDWADDGLEGVHRFFRRIWRYTATIEAAQGATIGGTTDLRRDLELRRSTARAIAKVTADLSGRYGFNTAIAALMSLSNDCGRALQDGVSTEVAREAVASLASLLQPFAPHIASEIHWRLAGRYVWQEPWPTAAEELLRTETLTLVVQVNAKGRTELTVPSDASVTEIEQAATSLPVVREATRGRTVTRVIVVAGRLVNVLVE